MQENWTPVKLAAKVIGHVSQGMYRTPAGAIKELVSNAYDAGASYAKIHTGFPLFSTFSCEDDGSGMEASDFKRLMEGGIGDSQKQNTEQQFGKHERPIIGRLGVGLLSLAQICTEFRVVSFHRKSRTAFEAGIRFPAYTRQELDELKRQIQESNVKYVTSGEYSIKEIPYKEGRTGITITTNRLRHSFRQTMSSLTSYGNYKYSKRKTKESYRTFNDYMEVLTAKSPGSLFLLSPYDQFVYQLALASPIAYFEPDVKSGRTSILLQLPLIQKLQTRLRSFQFRVELDNMVLARPLVLPSSDQIFGSNDLVLSPEIERQEFELHDGTWKEQVSVERQIVIVKNGDATFQFFSFSYNKTVNGYPLRFTGYIFIQTSRLFPKEYQGVLIRLRNVAIGAYDVNVMTYPYAEGPRFSMLTSEVFVEEGLDDGLKVDRDGFNGLDPHYMRVQAFMHSVLHGVIFSASWTEEKTRNKKKRDTLAAKRITNFKNDIASVTKGVYKTVAFRNEVPVASSLEPVRVDLTKGEVEIYERHPVLKSIAPKKKERSLAGQIMVAFEVANRENDPGKRREIFYKLLKGIFNE